MTLYAYIPVPLTKDGNGPASPEETVSISHEVWDECFLPVATCQSEEAARMVADALNARDAWRVNYPGVTPQQRRVWQGVAEGKAVKVIAHDMGLTAHTIKVHMRALFSTVKVTSNVQLALTYYGIKWRKEKK
jgi:DNA-binding NarL/FixJ family response regulator